MSDTSKEFVAWRNLVENRLAARQSVATVPLLLMSANFVCRKCYRNLTRFSSLLSSMEEDIDRAICAHSASAPADAPEAAQLQFNACITPPQPKRMKRNSSRTTASRAKRGRKTVHAGSRSPAVTVRITHLHALSFSQTPRFSSIIFSVGMRRL